jgi:hypothetical protein
MDNIADAASYLSVIFSIAFVQRKTRDDISGGIDGGSIMTIEPNRNHVNREGNFPPSPPGSDQNACRKLLFPLRLSKREHGEDEG